MLTNRNASNISFGIGVIVSPREYYKKPLYELRNAGKYVGGPFTLKESRFLDSQGYTEGMRICSAGILTAPDSKEFYMFHLNPEDFDNAWYAVRLALKEAQKRIKEGCKKPLEGFLLGANINNILSMGKAHNLINFFQGKGIKFSALLGQSTGDAAFHYSLPKNEVTVKFDGVWGVKNIADLRENFATVIKGQNEFKFEPKILDAEASL